MFCHLNFFIEYFFAIKIKSKTENTVIFFYRKTCCYVETHNIDKKRIKPNKYSVV